MNEIGNPGKAGHAEHSFISQVIALATAERPGTPVGTKRGRRASFLLCLVTILGAFCPTVHGQTGEWNWIAPSTPTTAYGNPGTTIGYKVKGSFDATNYPPARVRASIWVDAGGKVWMFGGMVNNRGYNDLWEYDPSTGLWAWMSGGVVKTGPVFAPGYGPMPASYGTQGVPAATNLPSARFGSATWIDSDGKLWLFGGSTDLADQMNDIWVYDPSTGYWTWMGGSQTSNQAGVYGTLGVVNSNNWPGSRDRTAFWTDSSGKLWLFGGFGCDTTTNTDFLNDLWKLDTKTLQWTWMGGGQTHNQVGTYGTKGASAVTNIPGARFSPSRWTDASGNFWLFGGTGYAADPSQAGDLDDLWQYSPTTGKWTWVSGDAAIDQSAVKGSVGVESASNTPGGRTGGAAWMDGVGNLWLVGGQLPLDTRSPSDIWRFNVSSGNWALMGGTSDPGSPPVYSAQGVASSNNDPGGRMDQSAWTDGAGNFWFFGGGSASGPNDLWEYQFSATAAPVFDPPGDTYNFDQTVTISDATPDAVIYYTTDGSTPTIHSTLYTAPISVDTPQTLRAIAVASGYLSSPVASADYKFNRLTAATPMISPPSGAYSTARP